MNPPNPSSPTPKSLGFHMPAEWEPHAGTWFTWPRPEGISFPGKYDTVPPVYAELIQHLVTVEDVHINVWNDDMEHWVRKLLQDHHTPLERVRFHHFPAYEPWCRDHEPTFIVRDKNGHRECAIVDWDYNAWGGKYPPFDLDDAVPQHIAKLYDLPLFSPKIILEGGSIDVNGQGTVLTTTSCLLNPNRNPALSQGDIENYLCEYLGVNQVLWLVDGIVGDDTDGHIDDLARFLNPTTIAVVTEKDRHDANYEPLKENLERLRSMKDRQGGNFRIVELPMPGLIENDGQRLPASYANFYIANGMVLVPTFNDPKDGEALAILQKEFPNRRVIGVDSIELIWGLGSFHCISQQEPLA